MPAAADQHHAASTMPSPSTSPFHIAGVRGHVLRLDGGQGHHWLGMGQAGIACGALRRFCPAWPSATCSIRVFQAPQDGTCPASAGWCRRIRYR